MVFWTDSFPLDGSFKRTTSRFEIKSRRFDYNLVMSPSRMVFLASGRLPATALKWRELMFLLICALPSVAAADDAPAPVSAAPAAQAAGKIFPTTSGSRYLMHGIGLIKNRATFIRPASLRKRSSLLKRC